MSPTYMVTAFGETFGPTPNIQQRYTFAGREASSHAAAPMFYRNRMYATRLGRFSRRDPKLGGDPLYNAYGFSTGNPVMYVDPMGLLTWSEWGSAIWSPLDALSANSAANEALTAAEKCGLSGLHNGPADAFRHCMWNCLMTQKIGACKAKVFADAHETESVNKDETSMDLHNNLVGRQLGDTNPNGNCNTLCMGAVNSGQLRQLRATGGGPVPEGTPLMPTGSAAAPAPVLSADPGVTRDPYKHKQSDPYEQGGPYEGDEPYKQDEPYKGGPQPGTAAGVTPVTTPGTTSAAAPVSSETPPPGSPSTVVEETPNYEDRYSR